MTRLLNAQDSADLLFAEQLLKAGELVAVATETVYGLAADASQPAAVQGIFKAKQRPANHPLIVHIGDIDQLPLWASNIPAAAWQLAQRHWPGPLTLVLEKAPHVNTTVTGGRDTIAVRIPAHPALLTLLKRSGLALAAPSANPHKALSPTSAGQVMASLKGKIAAVLDGGDCSLGIESTIVDLTANPPCILRAGPLTASQLSATLGCTVTQPQQHDKAVPGNMAVHYQPRTPLYIKTAAEIHQHTDYPVVRLPFDHSPAATEKTATLTRLMPTEKAAYARLLYRALFEADQLNADAIWLQQPPQEEAWADIHDRLNRANTKTQ